MIEAFAITGMELELEGSLIISLSKPLPFLKV